MASAPEQAQHESAASLLVEGTGELPGIVTLVVHPVEPLGSGRCATPQAVARDGGQCAGGVDQRLDEAVGTLEGCRTQHGEGERTRVAGVDPCGGLRRELLQRDPLAPRRHPGALAGNDVGPGQGIR